MQSHHPIMTIAAISRKFSEKSPMRSGTRIKPRRLFLAENPCQTAPRKNKDRPNAGITVSMRMPNASDCPLMSSRR